MEAFSSNTPDTDTNNKPLLSEAASKRKQRLIEAQERAKQTVQQQQKAIARSKRLKKVGEKIQKSATFLYSLTPAKWIDDLEHDQELADQLERINSENEREQERKRICREAERACLEAVREHLTCFLHEYPEGTYEEWIQELHPENVTEGTLDHRFYVEESDHRILWNESLEASTHTDKKDELGGGVAAMTTTTRVHVQARSQGLGSENTALGL